jgi:hypothetical protein
MDDRYCPACHQVVYRGGGANPLAPNYCPRCFVHAHRSVRLISHPRRELAGTVRTQPHRGDGSRDS